MTNELPKPLLKVGDQIIYKRDDGLHYLAEVLTATHYEKAWRYYPTLDSKNKREDGYSVKEADVVYKLAANGAWVSPEPQIVAHGKVR